MSKSIGAFQPGFRDIGAFQTDPAVGGLVILPTGITSDEELGVHIITTGSVDISPTGIVTAEVFGTAALSPGPIDISSTGITSEEVFGNHIIVRLLQDIIVSGIVSEEAIGNHKLAEPDAIRRTMAQALRDMGFTGGLGDMTLQWLISLGFTEGSLDDRWKQMLDFEGINSDGMSSRKRDFYETELGFPIGTSGIAINELRLEYWDST